MSTFQKPLRVVCTRTLGQAYALSARKAGVDLIDLDFLDIRYRTEALPPIPGEDRMRLAFTSGHAVKAYRALRSDEQLGIPGREAFTVGRQTATYARSAGFRIAATATDGATLAAALIADGSSSVLHPCAADSRRELPEGLAAAGIAYRPLVVYRKTPRPHRIEHMDALMVLSPSQVDVFLMKNELPPQLPVFCIGHTTAHYLREKGHRHLLVAGESSVPALMARMFEHFKIKANV